MKSDYITRAKKFVPFVARLLEEKNAREIKYTLYEYNYSHRRHISFASGLTRYAFITSDYVIKVDYNPTEIAHFGGCEDEITVYNEAKQDNMEYLFAAITPYEYNGRTYYIMPRINGIGRTEEDAFYHMNRKEIKWCREHGICDLHYLNYGWRNRHVCIIDYGERYL